MDYALVSIKFPNRDIKWKHEVKKTENLYNTKAFICYSTKNSLKVHRFIFMKYPTKNISWSFRPFW